MTAAASKPRRCIQAMDSDESHVRGLVVWWKGRHPRVYRRELSVEGLKRTVWVLVIDEAAL